MVGEITHFYAAVTPKAWNPGNEHSSGWSVSRARPPGRSPGRWPWEEPGSKCLAHPTPPCLMNRAVSPAGPGAVPLPAAGRVASPPLDLEDSTLGQLDRIAVE